MQTTRRRRPIPIAIRAEVWDRSNGKCHYCQKDLHPILEFEVDHIEPITLGGSDDIENLVAACRSCNARKGNRTPAMPNGPIKPKRVAPIPMPVRVNPVPVAEEWLTLAEAADRIKIGPMTLRKWLRDGEIKGTLMGNSRSGYRIAASEVDYVLAHGKRVKNANDD